MICLYLVSATNLRQTERYFSYKFIQFLYELIVESVIKNSTCHIMINILLKTEVLKVYLIKNDYIYLLKTIRIEILCLAIKHLHIFKN